VNTNLISNIHHFKAQTPLQQKSVDEIEKKSNLFVEGKYGKITINTLSRSLNQPLITQICLSKGIFSGRYGSTN
jgi:hypothetical protein